MADIDSDIIQEAIDAFIDNLIEAGQRVIDIFLGAVLDFGGGFIQGDLTANTPALLCLLLVIVGSGGTLAYKLSKG